MTMLDDSAADRIVLSTRRQIHAMIADARRDPSVIYEAELLRDVTVALLSDVPAKKQNKVKTLIARLETLIRWLAN